MPAPTIRLQGGSVTSDVSGVKQDAVFMRCTCGPQDWTELGKEMHRELVDAPSALIPFQIQGTTHLHLQCVYCSTSYCPAGACEVH